jgi:hypothetical protein
LVIVESFRVVDPMRVMRGPLMKRLKAAFQNSQALEIFANDMFGIASRTKRVGAEVPVRFREMKFEKYSRHQEF